MLIKSVVQALPSYATSVFKFSKGLCEELEHMTRDFWWGDEHDRKKIHWLSWEKLTRPEGQGGMGFRNLVLFNQALLARQAWRLLANPTSLYARLIKARYYPHGNILDTAFIQSTSPVWQGITHGLELLKKGYVWRIGNGRAVDIWRDNWLPRGNLRVSGKASCGGWLTCFCPMNSARMISSVDRFSTLTRLIPSWTLNCPRLSRRI